MFGFGKAINKAKGATETKYDKAGGIEWNAFNYPPCLRVIHFDPDGDPIPYACKFRVKWLKNTWYFMMVVLFINFCSTIGFVSSKNEPGDHILFSILQLLAGSVLGGIAVYQGYRHLAGQLSRNAWYYKVIQSILSIFMIVFMIIDSGNVRGFTAISNQKDIKPQPAFTLICILESSCWIVCFGLSVVGLWKVQFYKGNDYYTRTEKSQEDKNKDNKDPKKKGKKAGASKGDKTGPTPKKVKSAAEHLAEGNLGAAGSDNV